ncbi:MAG: patatin-like protein, partial [Pseudomonadales bacterium]|nr:patatin-like protein [Pseudomonadales bacterium]
SRRPDSTLLPPGQRLDVYSSITDLNGYPSSTRLHEELVANDREHGAFCRLSFRAHADAAASSDFHDDNLPALVWAARASSSYAGAFPPFRHDELRNLIDRLGIHWSREKNFLENNLFTRDGRPAHQVFDPKNRYFVDGGIVNNKPFSDAIQALGQRPADRRVNRHIVYIEPDPNVAEPGESGKTLSYLRTLQAALSTIPRNQPIVEQLGEIIEQDKRVQANRRIVETYEPRVLAMVHMLQSGQVHQELSADQIGYLRVGVARLATKELGLAFEAYERRRVWRLTEALMEEWVLLAEQPHLQSTRAAMISSIEQWWEEDNEVIVRTQQTDFLERFDVTFRIRRLQFVIRRLNQHAELESIDAISEDALGSFKITAYGFLEKLLDIRRARLIDDSLIDHLYQSARLIPLNRAQTRELLTSLSASMDLNELDQEIDAAFFHLCQSLTSEDLRRAFVADYVGFPVYDVLLYSPGQKEQGPDPLTRLRVERISPRDARSLSAVFEGLRSRTFMGFLGFFNRAYREHDYLWGRLHGAERMVDLLNNLVPGGIENAAALRLDLFCAIVQREKQRLYRCDDLLANLDALLAEMAAGSRS